jgi:hypothetical protein
MFLPPSTFESSRKECRPRSRKLPPRRIRVHKKLITAVLADFKRLSDKG